MHAPTDTAYEAIIGVDNTTWTITDSFITSFIILITETILNMKFDDNIVRNCLR